MLTRLIFPIMLGLGGQAVAADKNIDVRPKFLAEAVRGNKVVSEWRLRQMQKPLKFRSAAGAAFPHMADGRLLDCLHGMIHSMICD